MPDTPQNAQYMVAAYIVAAVVYLTYSLTLWLRARKALGAVRRYGGRAVGTLE